MWMWMWMWMQVDGCATRTFEKEECGLNWRNAGLVVRAQQKWAAKEWGSGWDAWDEVRGDVRGWGHTFCQFSRQYSQYSQWGTHTSRKRIVASAHETLTQSFTHSPKQSIGILIPSLIFSS